MTTRRGVLGGGIAAGMGMIAGPARAEASDPWPALAAQLFHNKRIGSGAGVIALDAPQRALDAALVPIAIDLVPSAKRQVHRLTLIIDGNPSPVAAVFELGPASGIDHIATHVRVDDYTTIHVVAEMSDGELLVVGRFVMGTGGCSAPALTRTADAIPLGTMRWHLFPRSADAPPDTHEAELVIRHPNYSGLQMDQLTRLYIPADFIQTLRVWQGERLLLDVVGGISLSQNPQFGFRFRLQGNAPFRADAMDTKGNRFHAEFPATAA